MHLRHTHAPAPGASHTAEVADAAAKLAGCLVQGADGDRGCVPKGASGASGAGEGGEGGDDASRGGGGGGGGFTEIRLSFAQVCATHEHARTCFSGI